MAVVKSTFIVCFLGIFVSYFAFGILQEKITKGNYGTEKFSYTQALVFVECIINAIFALIVISAQNVGKDSSPHTMYAIMSFSYLGAMIASNHALQYVSYPTQVLGKSAKPIPVMILGVILARKKYPWAKYLFVTMIVAGVALFMYKDKEAKGIDADHSFGSGEILLMVSLLLDGVTGGVQDKIRAEYVANPHRMMLNMNLWAIIYLAVGLLVTREGIEFIAFVFRYPSVMMDLLALSVASAVGQHFIFTTVTSFGPLACSIITTTRKFFTILASVIIFQHHMAARQWMGTLLVFMGLALDNLFGKEHHSLHQEKKLDAKT